MMFAKVMLLFLYYFVFTTAQNAIVVRMPSERKITNYYYFTRRLVQNFMCLPFDKAFCADHVFFPLPNDARYEKHNNQRDT